MFRKLRSRTSRLVKPCSLREHRQWQSPTRLLDRATKAQTGCSRPVQPAPPREERTQHVLYPLAVSGSGFELRPDALLWRSQVKDRVPGRFPGWSYADDKSPNVRGLCRGGDARVRWSPKPFHGMNVCNGWKADSRQRRRQRAQTDYAGGKSRPFGSEIQMTVCASAEWRDRWPLPCVSSTNTKLPA